MKRKLLLIICLLALFDLRAQIYQQTSIELDSEIPKDKSMVFEASRSIRLADGFYCEPEKDNQVVLTIDRYGVFPPEEGLLGGPSYSSNGVVGALPGTLDVGNLGAAIYSIPIQLPPGIGEITPKLAIVYNSQAGNGLMGWGWNISGLSSITRDGKTYYHDGAQSAVTFSGDRFVIDGKRLMLCSGNYGGNGAVYKTEVDEMSKIISYTDNYNGPSRFKVYKKDGTLWEYGFTDDSRCETQSHSNIVLSWLVNKITDADGNYMTFNYYENQSTGESYIDNIAYTLNNSAGIRSMYKVIFEYDDRSDYESGYVYENVVQNKRILKKILVKNEMSGAILYEYTFNYKIPGSNSNDYKFYYHRLSSIGLTANGLQLNPTKIAWNKSAHYPDKFLTFSLDKTIFNKVPFVGDFNGDGLSDVLTVPYKTGNSYSGNVMASVYINNGDGSFNNNPSYTFTFDRTLEWVYIVDFDGDGLDDVVPYFANYNNNYNWKSKIRVFLNRGNDFTYAGEYMCDRYFTVYPGDFCGDNKVSLFVTYINDNASNPYYPAILYCNNNYLARQSLGSQSYSNVPQRVVVEDINADGCHELIYLMSDKAAIAKINYQNNQYQFSMMCYDNNLDSEDFLFPGDFNGDGYTDFLKYDNQTYWKVAFSDGKKLKTPVSCQNNNLLRNLILVPQDRYTCSLQNLAMPSETIRTGDFDGDGKADVAVFKNTGGNYYAQIGFKMHDSPDGIYIFEEEKRFYFNISFSHQYVHVGNFLGCENVSILGSVKANPGTYEVPKIVALNPHSSKYSVERIVDGLGNAHGFKYQYLMPGSNSIYEYDFQWINNALRTVTVPVRALAADTLFSIDNKLRVTKYKYKNAVYHKNGHGLLGFERTETNLYVNNSVFETKIFENDLETLAENYWLLPKSLLTYNYCGQLMSFEQSDYAKYSCNHNEKVIMPLIINKKSVTYNAYVPNSIIKTTVENYAYQTDSQGNTYSDIIVIDNSTVGIDDNYSGDDAMACSYWESTAYTFNNNVSNWVVSRPQSVMVAKHYEDNDAVGSCEILEYSDDNPYHVTRKTMLPNVNMNYSDPLKIVADYSYDAVGHAVAQSLTSPSSKSVRVTSVDYGEEYNYRFPTSATNEQGWETVFGYDGDYGNMTSSVDYNQFEMSCASVPFEITIEKALPGGIKNVKTKRWARGNMHAPQNAVFYYWEKSNGQAEKMTFFSKNGKKMREVTLGLNDEAIYVDYEYDDYDNLVSKSMPYKSGDDAERCYYVYDRNNKLIEEIYPNGLVKNYSYNGLQTVINTVSPEGVSHTVIETSNPLGWRMQTIDIGGNSIDYEYYSDGKIKSSMINGVASTKVEYEYDCCRNLLRINDPASGVSQYVYNAYGELVEKTTARNCVTTYDYDSMGNLLHRVESDASGQEVVATQWVYDNKKGRVGTLTNVIYGDKQTISYSYDDLLRVVSKTETINGKEYQTLYSYDRADREEFVTYPSGVEIQNVYSNSGYLRSILTITEEKPIWQTNDADAQGNILDFEVGNGLKTNMSYNDKTKLLEGIYTQKNDVAYQDLSYEYDGFGNLIGRSNLKNKLVESFDYDNFNRLTEIRLNGKTTGETVYDDFGNILSKIADRQSIYYDAQYNGNCPYAVTKVTTDIDDFEGLNQNIEYTAFDKIKIINSGNNSLSIDYGYDYNRIRSVEIVDGKQNDKVYVSDCEFVSENNEDVVYTFLNGPMGIFAVCCTNNKGDNSIVYVHKDHLGSWCLVTDSDGKIMQKTSFDAWGNARDDETWTGKYKGKLLCDRGFTGHEHMKMFGFINMNGRAYDPLLSMMMSPDEFIQTPDFSQNYNRYSYCYNNPLTYHDPTGEWVEWLMYGLFNGAINVACNYDDIDSFAEGLLSFGAGFINGCLTQGLSECSWVLQVAGGVTGATLKSGVNNLVKQNTGQTINWSLVITNDFKEDFMYGLGSSLAKSVLNAYLVQPTDTNEGETIASFLCKEKVNRRLLETASKKIVGNIFAGRNMFAGFGITKDNWEDALPYFECLVDIVGDKLEFETSSETLSNLSDRVMNFDFSGVAKKYGSDINYCYSQFRALFVKKVNN